MEKKGRKLTFLTAAAIAMLCAGTVSARQLRSRPAAITFCRGTCSATKPCSGPCFCIIPTGSTSGGCAKDPGPVRPPTQSPQ